MWSLFRAISNECDHIAKALIAGLIILSCGRSLHSARTYRPFESDLSHQECMLILQQFRPFVPPFLIDPLHFGGRAPTPAPRSHMVLSDSITALGSSDSRASARAGGAPFRHAEPTPGPIKVVVPCDAPRPRPVDLVFRTNEIARLDNQSVTRYESRRLTRTVYLEFHSVTRDLEASG